MANLKLMINLPNGRQECFSNSVVTKAKEESNGLVGLVTFEKLCPSIKSMQEQTNKFLTIIVEEEKRKLSSGNQSEDKKGNSNTSDEEDEEDSDEDEIDEPPPEKKKRNV